MSISFHTVSNDSSVATSPVMNPRLTTDTRINLVVGEHEINSPTGALIELTTDHPRVAAPAESQCLVGTSIRVDANAMLVAGQTQRSVWGLNIEARTGAAAGDNPAGTCPSDDHCGLEIDMLNEHSDAPSDVYAPGHSYGLWVQAHSATNRLNGTALFVSALAGGWRNLMHCIANVTDWLLYLKTTSNTPGAKGIHVETQWAASTGTIAEFSVAGVTKFKVDGAIGGPQNGVWLYTAGQLREVQVGAVDSAGAGFRTLRVAN